ncbi:hypothetical protein N4P33_29835 [Streptomyces sp. 15-116A]|uniref:hypothetical protein n=1 Tax=Streptomyces sp. 15-116A TaxID=2259035 RepID=UPI0021B3EA67|nr:hypothetical protein [Streptomyces sp. 15-116A]MCT7356314.1 hypothetical protein [Streptomyces sp. 15-116A]
MKKTTSRVIATTALTAGAVLASVAPAQAGIIDGSLNNPHVLSESSLLGALAGGMLDAVSNTDADTGAKGNAGTYE